MKKRILMLLLLGHTVELPAQNSDKAFIRMAFPARETNAVRNSKQFISGATCKGCLLTVNGTPAKVYPTGGFAHELDLKPGTNIITIEATSGKTVSSKKLTYNFSIPTQDTVKTLGIATD